MDFTQLRTTIVKMVRDGFRRVVYFGLSVVLAGTILILLFERQRFVNNKSSFEKLESRGEDLVFQPSAINSFNWLNTNNKFLPVKEFWEAEALYNAHLDHPPKKACFDVKRYGGGDGSWYICEDPGYKLEQPCLIYSIGIAFNFQFDDAMAKKGCVVHSFDPSMNTADHKHAERVWFHNIGISNADHDDFNPRKDMYVKKTQVWKVRTLASLQRMLGHEKKTIDILKMDVEGYEFDVLKNMIESGALKHVKQLLTEYHVFTHARKNFLFIYRVTQALYAAGFKVYWVRKHPVCKLPELCNQADIHMINTRYVKPPS